MGWYRRDKKENTKADLDSVVLKNEILEKLVELEVQKERLINEINELKEEKKILEDELEETEKVKEKLQVDLNKQNSLVDSLTNLINKNLDNENKDGLQLIDYLNRQRRIYKNKENHGFNTTNIYQEARYILEETAELMRAIEKNDRENILEELADIVIFSYGCAEIARLGDLDKKIFEKMSINEKRIYKRNEEGDFVKNSYY